jgi:putative methyltransferase (TIGR04325 family)
MTSKQILKSVLPPVIWNLLKSVQTRIMPSSDCLTYAPQGWATKLPNEPTADNVWAKYMARELQKHEGLIRRAQNAEPLLIDPKDYVNRPTAFASYMIYMTYAYVLTLAAHEKRALKVLDYGGGLGDYYWFGKAMLPGIELEYHCMELPAVVEEVRKVSPAVIWHTDDACLGQQYDMVMLNSSLQYIQDWQGLLRRAAAAVRIHLFLSRAPTVERVPGYVAVQRVGDASVLCQQHNRADVLGTVQDAGLRLVREFLMGEHPWIRNAPEQPSVRGWLFQRDAGRA